MDIVGTVFYLTLVTNIGHSFIIDIFMTEKTKVICLFQNHFVNKLTDKSSGTGAAAQLVKTQPSMHESLGSIARNV